MTNLYIPFLSGIVRINLFAIPAYAAICFVEGTACFAVLIAGALLHELGHVYAIKKCKSHVISVAIEPFGAVITYADTLTSYHDDTVIALAGVFINLVLAFISSVVLYMVRSPFLLVFLFANLFFAAVNLIPLKGNDGSNVLRAYCMQRYTVSKTERIVKAVSVISVSITAGMCLLLIWFTGANASVIAILLFILIPK